MDPATIKIITDAGTIGVCMFVIWMGWKREERAAGAFEKLNQNSQMIQNQTVMQLTQLTETTRALHEEIRSRPCVEHVDWNGTNRRHPPERK